MAVSFASPGAPESSAFSKAAASAISRSKCACVDWRSPMSIVQCAFASPTDRSVNVASLVTYSRRLCLESRSEASRTRVLPLLPLPPALDEAGASRSFSNRRHSRGSSDATSHESASSCDVADAPSMY